MAQTIKLKRNSENNDTAPVAGDLAVGEIAVNSVSGKLYTKKSDDSVVEISGSGGASSGGGGGTPELTFTVTVADVSGADKYHLAGATSGFASATAAPTVDLQRGFTYKFDQSDSSNATHPLIITTSSTGGTTATAYTTGVTTTGTLGVDRVLTFVVPHSAADTMYYQCSAHTGLGAELDVGDTIVAGATNLPIYDEDELLASSISKLNFTGTGVTATYEVESVTTPGDADWAKVTALISGGETVSTSTVSGDDEWDNVHCLLSLVGSTNAERNAVRAGATNPWEDPVHAGEGNDDTWSSSYKKFGDVSIDATDQQDAIGWYDFSPYAKDMNFTNASFTIEAWIYLDSHSVGNTGTNNYAFPCIFHKGYKANFGVNNGVLTYGYYNTSSNWVFVTHQTTVTTGAWHHVAVTVDYPNTDLYLFVDGVKQTSTHTWQGQQATASNAGQQFLGKFSQGGNYEAYLRGYIGEFRVTETVARYTEDFDLPTAAFPIGASSTSTCSFPESSGTTPHTVTVKGGQTALDTTTVPAANGTKPTGITYGGAMKFDGTDDYYTIPSDADFAFGAVDSTDNDFTIESWVYLASDVAGDCVLFDGRTAAANAVVPLLEVKSNKLTYTVNGVALITDSADLTTNTWHHIAIIRSGANTVVAKNGTTIGGTTTASTYVACPWTIGASSASSATAFFKGWMEEWRVTKGKTRYTVTTEGSSGTADNSGWGGTVTTHGDYSVHTFLASGYFKPSIDMTTSIFVLAGGGGGGGHGGGGGGGGGFRTATSHSLTTNTSPGHTITVGAGGDGGAPVIGDGAGINGEDSSVGSFTSSGGGGGGGYYLNNGPAINAAKDGGSGGGTGKDGGAAGGLGNTPSTSPSQGYNGGSGRNGGGNGAGGGGGAGAVGQQAGTSEQGGYGGAGASNDYRTGSGILYAGGGGGGTNTSSSSKAGEGGSGGGKKAHWNSAPTNNNDCDDNTGGGGGAGSYGGNSNTRQGGDGGSGIIVIRYLTADLSYSSTTYSTDYDPSDWTTVFPTSTSTTTTTPTVDVAITGGGSGSALTVKDENTTLATAATQIGFTGSGITASGANNIITVDVPGGTLPSGGSLGQVLAKNTAASGDAGWIDVTNSATMTNTSTETYFTEVGNGANVTSTSTTPGDTYWSDVVFFARGSETVSTGSSGDPHWQYVTTLITGDETQTGLTFPSAGSVAQTWTRTSGVTQTTGSGGKFGEAYEWDGGSASRIQTIDNSGWALGAPSGNTNDFTIEMWMYTVDQTADNPNETFISKGYGTGWMPQQISNSPLTYRWYADCWGSGGMDGLGTFTLSNGWNHIAFVREGTTERVYVNGAMKLSGTRSEDFTAGTEVPVIGNTIIGTSNDLSPHGMSDGCKMEQIRITKGLCRYKGTSTTDWDNKLDDGTTVWTEPTAAYPTE